jgi:hypothetical protein
MTFVGEKLTNDFEMFEAIASFVEKGSYIQMAGEDFLIWRWYFRRKLYRRTARTLLSPPRILLRINTRRSYRRNKSYTAAGAGHLLGVWRRWR